MRPSRLVAAPRDPSPNEAMNRSDSGGEAEPLHERRKPLAGSQRGRPMYPFPRPCQRLCEIARTLPAVTRPSAPEAGRNPITESAHTWVFTGLFEAKPRIQVPPIADQSIENALRKSRGFCCICQTADRTSSRPVVPSLSTHAIDLRLLSPPCAPKLDPASMSEIKFHASVRFVRDFADGVKLNLSVDREMTRWSMINESCSVAHAVMATKRADAAAKPRMQSAHAGNLLLDFDSCRQYPRFFPTSCKNHRDFVRSLINRLRRTNSHWLDGLWLDFWCCNRARWHTVLNQQRLGFSLSDPPKHSAAFLVSPSSEETSHLALRPRLVVGCLRAIQLTILYGRRS